VPEPHIANDVKAIMYGLPVNEKQIPRFVENNRNASRKRNP
jgi:hypothetical protein